MVEICSMHPLHHHTQKAYVLKARLPVNKDLETLSHKGSDFINRLTH